MKKLRILIVGAGAVGSYYGSLLTEAGHEVIFIARGTRLETLKNVGVKIISEKGNLHIPSIKAYVFPPKDFHPDVCILTVKNYDLARICQKYCKALNSNVTFLTLQNGINAADVVQSYLPHSFLLAGVTYTNLEKKDDGSVRLLGKGANIFFGSYSSKQILNVDQLASIFNDAGIHSAVRNNIVADLWTKLSFISPISGITSIFNSEIGTIRNTPKQWELCQAAIRESVLVASSYFPILPKDLYEQHIIRVQSLPFNSSSSLSKDIREGNRTELNWLAGTILSKAKERGIEVPIHKNIVERLSDFLMN